MNESRVQAYLELIQQLLACPGGEESGILQAHQELLDAGFAETVLAVAAQAKEQGEENAARFLENLAAQLAQALGLELPGMEVQSLAGKSDGALRLLQALLQTELQRLETQGSPQMIFEVLRRHLAHLNLGLIPVMQTVVRGFIAENPEAAEDMVALIENISIDISDFPLGNRADNLEITLAGYGLVLEVRTREQNPQGWAQTTMNLANAYYSRIRGDRADNLEQAIAHYEQALAITTHKALRATMMNNLANAYKDRIRGDRAENIEQAIARYEQALAITTDKALRATMMNNLANAYKDRIRGDRAENLEQAIAAYGQALTVMTPAAMPVEWAQTMMNLANAYSDRIRGDRAENLEQAIRAYQSSLEVFDPQLLPDDCRKAARSLGNLYAEQKQWPEAAAAYQTALQAAEILYQSATLLDSKAAELAETADLPRRAAYALAKIGNLQQAALTLEQGRARGLSESLERDRADLSQLEQSHPDLYTQYRDITHQLRDLETQQRFRQTSDERHEITPEFLRNTAQHLRQTLTTTLDQIRQIPGYETFLTQPSFDDIRAALKPEIPLVYLVPTPAGSLALIVTRQNIEPIWLDDLPESQVREILYGPADDPELGRWLGAYQAFRNNPKANYLAWCKEIEQTTRQLWEPLMAPLITHLKTHNFTQATLIPTGYLSLLPLHAAWVEDPSTPTGKRYALDDIHFTYAPNARSLRAAQAIADRTPADTLLAIDNPRNDLPNSCREITAASRTFPNSQVLSHSQATVAAVLNALPHCNILHLSCHGTANLTEPLTSGLLMHDGLLTLRDLLDLKLADTPTGGIRLAILSACETGLAGIELADEAISLPTGLLQAGVAGAIASLWSVSDLSTMLLLTRFYDLWRRKNLAPAVALRQAQQWLRDTPDGEIADYAGLVTLKRSDRTYAHPFHWAAFSYTGV
ncbi:CHAT domain-containing protein [Trichothermofontia sp.]